MAYQPTPSPGILRPASPADPYSPGTGGYIYTANNQDADNEADVLLMALITVGVAAGAGVLALIGYAIRNRIGFWPHRPPPREGSAPEHH